jgi:hypothetical protein
MRPESPDDEAPAMEPGAFRALLETRLGIRDPLAGSLRRR